MVCAGFKNVTIGDERFPRFTLMNYLLIFALVIEIKVVDSSWGLKGASMFSSSKQAEKVLRLQGFRHIKPLSEQSVVVFSFGFKSNFLFRTKVN